ncbi:MAG TPA: caspase family protein [Polyangiaceae bacterium]
MAHADPAPHPHPYAIVVGSNTGGAGQEPLRYAEDDARRVADVLRQLGHYEGADVRVLLHPDAAHVLSAIDEVAGLVRGGIDHGEQAVVTFYYSGHARANAVNLGGDELALTTLREKLRAVPSGLTIVVLDACQSGAFSRIKGAEPAADFTYNSVSALTQKGLAVMASSSSQELSQESDELRSSYFTHHLTTALRGAGDADGDGRVSLDEAYRYAYRRTLVSTARTQVGEQHVTLETDLAGQGEVAVTFPAEARSHLELPGPLDARVLVQHRPSGAVVAELQKAPGPPIRLAFAAGPYDAIVRQKSGILQCRFSLSDDAVTTLDTSGCTPVTPDHTTAKGEAGAREPREIDRWEIEGGIGFTSGTTDGYTDRLQEFGYDQQKDILGLPRGRLALGASRKFMRHIAGVAQVMTLGGDTYERSIAGSTDTTSLSAYGGALYIRAFTDVAEPWLGVYGQAGAGMTLGVLDFKTQQTGVAPSTTTTYAGYLLSGAVGMTLRFDHYLTMFVQAGYDRAPAINNLIGDTHDSGGLSGVLGARWRLGDDRW